MNATEMVAMMALLFYWVPFAVAAYIVDVWIPEHGKENLFHPIRHMRHSHAH